IVELLPASAQREPPSARDLGRGVEEALMEIEHVLVEGPRPSRASVHEVARELGEHAEPRADVQITVDHEAREQVRVAGPRPPARVPVVLVALAEVSTEREKDLVAAR